MLVGGVICLVDSDNERDSRATLADRLCKQQEGESDNRSVMPLDVPGGTRVTIRAPAAAARAASQMRGQWGLAAGRRPRTRNPL